MATQTPEQIESASAGGGSYKISGVSTGGRAYVVSGVSNPDSTTVSSPTAGASIDGVAVEVQSSSGSWVLGVPATPGLPVQVRAGGSVTSGDDLQVQGDGDFVTASGGTVVARAVEGASAGSFFWAVFT